MLRINEDWKYVISGLSIVLGVLIIYPIGLFSAIIHLHILLFGGGQSNFYYFILGLLVLFLGLVMIIVPKIFKIRFLVSSTLSFISAFIFLIINLSTIPHLIIMKKQSNDAPKNINIDSNSAIQNVDYIFYENFLYFLLLFFFVIGIILIIIYVRYDQEKN